MLRLGGCRARGIALGRPAVDDTGGDAARRRRLRNRGRAVAEAVSDKETGFLLPRNGTGTIAREAVKILFGLCTDRDLLQRVSSAAAGAAKAWTWQNSAQDFLQRLDRLTAG